MHRGQALITSEPVWQNPPNLELGSSMEVELPTKKFHKNRVSVPKFVKFTVFESHIRTPILLHPWE